MKTVFVGIIILFVAGCNSWHRGYRPFLKENSSEIIKEIDIQKENFYHLRLCRDYKIFKEAGVDDPALINYYDICDCGSNDIVEENYLYLENFSKHLKGEIDSGSVIIFDPFRYEESKTLERYYSSCDTLFLAATRETKIGKWSLNSNNKILLELSWNEGEFAILAEKNDGNIIFKNISHPNLDENNRGKDIEPRLEITSILDIGNDTLGLVYKQSYLNVNRQAFIKNMSSITKIYLYEKWGRRNKNRVGYYIEDKDSLRVKTINKHDVYYRE